MSAADSNTQNLFTSDQDVIRTHLELLFRRARIEYPDGLCEIAWDQGDGIKWGSLFPISPEGLDRATAEAVAQNHSHFNVYVGVNPRKPGTRSPTGRAKAADVEIAFHQFAESDSAEGAQKVLRAPLAYTFAVITGRVPNPRVHPYWTLEEPIRNLAAWGAQQKALATTFAGDEMSNADRVLRLAGTVSYPNQKKIERGYRVERVTLRYLYGDEFAPEERAPVSSETLFRVYPWTGSANDRVNPDTGEVHDRDAGDGGPQRPDFTTGRVDPQEYVRAIREGRQRHDHTLLLVAHLVASGYPEWVIVETLTSILPHHEGDTLKQLPEMIRSAQRKFSQDRTHHGDAQPDDEDFSAPPPGPKPLIIRPIGILDPRVRPPRDWLVPYRMMRKHITMTTAAPGVGKSTLTIEEGISLASGVDFLNFGISGIKRVAIVNNEETQDELERRIEATCEYFGVDPAAIAETLFVYSGVDADKLVVARRDGDNVVPTVQADQLVKLTQEMKFDLVILDPFVQLHYVEENSNEQISRVFVEMRKIGLGEYPAAIHVVHHNRKPAAGNSHQSGDINAARGAGSMGGEAHFFFTLTDMSDEDGEKMNILDEDRDRFIRLDDAKKKLAPAQGARWFRRHGVLMPYGAFGEEVGVLIPHVEDASKARAAPGTATEVLKEIDRAWEAGNPYSESHVAKNRYVVPVIMKHFGWTRNAAKELLDDWLTNGVVVTELRDQHRNLRGLRVAKWPG